MIKSAALGFPRIGPNREMKMVIESYWSGKSSQSDVESVSKTTRINNWKLMKEAGVDFIPCGDFSLYDQVLDHCLMFDIIPDRYTKHKLSDFDIYFAMARGLQRQQDGQNIDLQACEMKKWFDSNYHYIVPEYSSSTSFSLRNTALIHQYLESKSESINTRPVLIGPISLLLLGKRSSSELNEKFKSLDLLNKLVVVYIELLQQLQANGVEWVQIDEPMLCMDIAQSLESEYKDVYTRFSQSLSSLKIMLTTYFSSIPVYTASLPVHGIHVDLVRAPQLLDELVPELCKRQDLVVELGLVNGRNVWKCDINKIITDPRIRQVVELKGVDHVIIATSSSLLHVPHTLEAEKKTMKAEVYDWFSFAKEKCIEISLISKLLSSPAGSNHSQELSQLLNENIQSIERRRQFERENSANNADINETIKNNDPQLYKRKSEYVMRTKIQREILKLPVLPATTIGSFPQTNAIRSARARYGKKELTTEQYEEFIRAEIQHCISKQEEIGLDILVHGEPERNDMVQYFAELLQGFVVMQYGWTVSFGTRYVRPPILVSDIRRLNPMTIRWIVYSQSLTQKPVKGMLTGPVTMLNWSFPRIDISNEIQCKQIAIALRSEILELQQNNIRVIQVDEPALREGLPLKAVDREAYLKWAVDSFKLATSGVEDSTQIHSHFCYSDFNDIFDAIDRLDADAITIENSKSAMKLLEAFKIYKYQREIGPGLYDIHSPRVPSVEEMYERISAILKYIPIQNLHVNPDCGLKTRGWAETEQSLKNMIAAAKKARDTLHFNKLTLA